MKKRPLCLLCMGLMLAIWALKLAGAPIFGEPALPQELESRLEEGMTLHITGTILSRTDKSDSIQYILTDTSLTYQKKNISLNKILLSLQDQETLHIGDRIDAVGKLKALQEPGNPGQFDSKAYYACKGIYYSMWGNQVTLLERPASSLQEALQAFRQKVTDKLQTLVPDKIGGVLAVMTWGEKEYLAEESRLLYQISGLSHILSISGLHISLLGLGLFRLLLELGLPDQAAAPLAASIMGIYCILVGGQPSALRACIMFAVMLGARLLGRSYDLLSALSLAGILILLEHPGYLFYSGFQLSFAAVLGAGVVYPLLSALMPVRLRKALKPEKKQKSKESRHVREVRKAGEARKGEKVRIREKFREGRNFPKKTEKLLARIWQASASWLAVNAVLLPLIAYYFYEIPVYSLLANLLLVPLSGLVLASGIAGSLLGLVHDGLGKLVLLPAVVCLETFQLVITGTAHLPQAVWICGQPSLWQVFFYYLGLAGILVLLKRIVRQRKEEQQKQGKKQAAQMRKNQGKCQSEEKRSLERIKISAAIGLAAAICLLLFWRSPAGVSVTALDVGQGDCLAVTSGQRVYLVDGGSSDVNQVGKYRILPYLKQQGIGHLEGIFLTHPDQDHMNGIQELLESMRSGETVLTVERLLVPWWMQDLEEVEDFLKLAEEAGVSVSYLQTGDSIRVGKLQIQILHPSSGSLTELSTESSTKSSPGSSLEVPWEGNAGSLVLELTSGDFKGLLTGDLEGEGEEAVTELIREGRYDYLKVAHHGSRNSSSEAFLEAVQPEVCIISAPKNSIYGHPHKETLDRIEEQGADWYQTGICGAIKVEIREGKMKVETYL